MNYLYYREKWSIHIKNHLCALVLCDCPYATPHSNNTKFHIGYILNGEMDHTLNNVTSHLTAGDYFFVDLNITQSYTGSKDLKVLNFIFLPEAIDPSFHNFTSFSQVVNSPFFRFTNDRIPLLTAPCFHDDDGSVLKWLEQIQQELQDKKPGHHHAIRSIIQLLIIHLMRADNDAQQPADDQQLLQKALRLIDQNLGDGISLQQVAEKLNYSADHIGRLFREQMNISFTSYVQRARLAKSCQYLLETDWSIEKVAATAGYQSVRFYHQLFRRYYSITPLQYRKRAKITKMQK